MRVTIDLPEDIEARLQSEARAAGVQVPQLVREVLIEHLEDLEDRQVAADRIQDPRGPVSSRQMRTNLGLDS